MSSYSFQYIRRRPHTPFLFGNPFTAEWKLIDGVYRTDTYSQLKSVRWMYENTIHGDDYLADLIKQDRINQRGFKIEDIEAWSIGEQIDRLLTWNQTELEGFYADMQDITEHVYDV